MEERALLDANQVANGLHGDLTNFSLAFRLLSRRLLSFKMTRESILISPYREDEEDSFE